MKELNLWSVVAPLLSRPKLVFGFPITAALVAGAIAFMMPREYTANGSFAAQEASQQVGGLGALASQFGFAAGRATTNSPQFYADLLESREVLRRIALMYVHPEPGTADSVMVVDFLKARGDDTPMKVARTVDRLKKVVTVTTDRNTGIVRFSVDTRSMRVSNEIANALIEEMNGFNLERRQTQARGERMFTGARVEEARKSLDDAEQALAAFYSRNRSWRGSPELEVRESSLQRQVSVRQQVYLGLVESHERARIEEVRSTPTVTVLERPDGFVAKKPKGSVKIAVATLFLAAVLTSAMAFFLEYVAVSRKSGNPEFAQVVEHTKAIRRSTGLRRGMA